MDRGIRGVDREPWGAAHANHELVLAGLRADRGMWLRGAYVLEVYLADCARAHRIQHNGPGAYRGYQSTIDAGRCV